MESTSNSIITKNPDEDRCADNMDGICLTELEFIILTRQRDQFLKTDIKTTEMYLNFIQQEISCLRKILTRHKLLCDSTVEQNPYVINVKKLIASFCLELILNDPVEIKHWNELVQFCVEFTYDCNKLRDEVFESILAEDIPEKVYILMSFCEHEISGNYAKVRNYLSQGLKKHKDCLELYTTRLTLEIGECYTKRCNFLTTTVYTQEDKDIIFGNHMLETYKEICLNFDTKESHVIQALDKLVKDSCDEFPCSPVRRLKSNILEDWKQNCPERAVAEIVSLEASILLDTLTENNIKETLAMIFKTYLDYFVKNDENPEILHRAIATFRSLDHDSTPVRLYLYLTLDTALYYQCLTPEHVDFYFKQLTLENNSLAISKIQRIFRSIDKSPRLKASPDMYHVLFATAIRLFGPQTNNLLKLLKKASNSLQITKTLLTVFARACSQVLIQSSNSQIVNECFKDMFKWLHSNLQKTPSLLAEMIQMLISWHISQGKTELAKSVFLKLKEIEYNKSIHSDLLNQLLWPDDRIRSDPDTL